MLIATTYYPSLDPVGPILFAAIAIGLACAFLCSSVMPAKISRAAQLVTPALILAALAVMPGSPVFFTWYFARSFPNLVDFEAAAILLAFGFGLSLSSLRDGGRIHRKNGVVFSFIFGGYSTWWFFDLAQAIIVPGRPYDFMGIAAALLFFIVWTFAVAHLNRRWKLQHAQTNDCCYACEYDLRGNAESRDCPECGTAIPWRHSSA